MSGQNETKVANTKRNETDVYIGRGEDQAALGDVPIGERGWLGNPFVTKEHGGDYTRSESITRFRERFEARIESDKEFKDAIRGLAGKTLGGWCQELEDDTPACHGEVIAEWADKLSNQSDLSQFD